MPQCPLVRRQDSVKTTRVLGLSVPANLLAPAGGVIE